VEKSTEERLADIESGITNLTKMQGCLFRALLILHRISSLLGRSERSLTELEESLGFAHRRMDRSLVLMFGAIAVVGIATSMYSLYFATLDRAFRVMSAVCFISVFGFFFFSFLEYRRANSQFHVAQQKLTQARGVVDLVGKEVAASDEELGQVVTEWKELVPDDLVSESSNGTPGPNDSRERN
jgi:hypothetical protein